MLQLQDTTAIRIGLAVLLPIDTPEDTMEKVEEKATMRDQEHVLFRRPRAELPQQRTHSAVYIGP